MEKYADRLLCAVTVEDNVKIVTLRSTYLVENLTFYPLELMLVDHTGHPVYSLEKIGRSLLGILQLLHSQPLSSWPRLCTAYRSCYTEQDQTSARS